MHQIKVINGNKETISDRFDGIAYHFAPGDGKNISLEAAEHIFGVRFPMDAQECDSPEFRKEIFEHLARRWGFNTHNRVHNNTGTALFKKFTFVPVELKTVELAAKNSDLPLPRGDKTDMIEDSEEQEA